MTVQTPDFQQAKFTPETENLYCPTSPTGRAVTCEKDKDFQDEATLKETYQSVKDAIAQKEAQLDAMIDVVGAEANLVKKSTVITIVSLVATFTFACFCWLVVNGTLAVGLAQAGWHYLTIGFILLLINAIPAVIGFTVVQEAYPRISLRPAFDAMLGRAGMDDAKQGESL